MVTSHSQSLSGLSAGTVYHYRVKSRDASGNLATSSDFTFTTSSGSTPAASCDYFVSPTGASSGPGTIDNPWSLAYALSGSGGTITPGKTVCLRAGTYTGQFTTTLNGSSGNPITVRNYPHERVVLNITDQTKTAALLVRGSWTNFIGLEFTDTATSRTNNTGGSNSPDAIYFQTSDHIKIINCVVHDMNGTGIGYWAEATNAEIYGCLLFYNGNTAGNNDHGIYVQNSTSTKALNDTIIFGSATYGIHMYAQGTGLLNGITMNGNVSFNNLAQSGGTGANVLLGGTTPAQNITFTNNHTYSPGTSNTNSRLGYSTTANLNLTATGNYFVNGGPTLNLNHWSNVTFTGNLNYATSTLVNDSLLTSSEISSWIFNHNAYYFTGSGSPFVNAFGSRSFTQWKADTGFDAASTFAASTPPDSVVIRANAYERGRANIIVYNWSNADSVNIDLSRAGLIAGDSYEIRDVQNYFGAPVASGTYTGGTISVPTTATVVATPIDAARRKVAHTPKSYNVWVVIRTS
jgi:hypothetical protein